MHIKLACGLDQAKDNVKLDYSPNVTSLTIPKDQRILKDSYRQLVSPYRSSLRRHCGIWGGHLIADRQEIIG